MDFGISGRRAAIAASSGGLGLASARALAAEGVRVALCGRDTERLDAAVDSGAIFDGFPRTKHQAEALDDTFELDLFSPIRQDWLDHTDDYFHRK